MYFLSVANEKFEIELIERLITEQKLYDGNIGR